MSTDRDANGRFLPGHPGMGGRPRRAVEADYLAALSDRVPMERWDAIVDAMVNKALAGDVRAAEWLGSYLAGKPTGNALRRLAAAEAAAIPAAAVAEATTANDELDVALDMEARVSPEQRTALAALAHGQSETTAARLARVSPGKVRRWLRDDPTFLAAYWTALSERDGCPRAELAALGLKAVAVLRAALDGDTDSNEVRAAIEVIKLLRLDEPAPSRATDPAAASRAIAQRADAELFEDLLTPPLPSWSKGDSEEEDE
jgi:hypothetical protein